MQTTRLQRGTGHRWGLAERHRSQRNLVISRGRHDRHTGKAERKPQQSRPLFRHPLQQAEQEQRRRRRDADDEEEELGWWQQPASASTQPESEELEEWQVERLEEAYAVGRRKVAISKLSDELDLDRSFILDWFKQFGQRPAQEVEAIVQRHKQRLQQQQGAMAGPVGDPLSLRGAAGEGQGEASTSGNVPFYVRQEMGLSRRRLSSETLRTLETLYSRTPFPSNDVIKGLYDMYRLPRELAIEWFEKRRQLEPGRQQADAGAAGAAAGRGDKRKELWTFVRGSRQQQQQQQQHEAAVGPKSELSDLLGDAQLPEGVTAAGEQLPPQREAVYKLTPRELAKVVSSLPSPRKQKGIRLAEELGIKAGSSSSSRPSSSSSSSSSSASSASARASSSSAVTLPERLQIAGVKYAMSDGTQLWRQRWRRWRSREGLPGRHLDWGQWYTLATLAADGGSTGGEQTDGQA